MSNTNDWLADMRRALASAEATQKTAQVASAGLAAALREVDRDQEFARRSVNLALSGIGSDGADGVGLGATAAAAAAAAEAEAATELTIAMLVKRPALAPLETWVRYHRHLGVRRFLFFFDDTTSGADDPAPNDEAAAMLLAAAAEAVRDKAAKGKAGAARSGTGDPTTSAVPTPAPACSAQLRWRRRSSSTSTSTSSSTSSTSSSTSSTSSGRDSAPCSNPWAGCGGDWGGGVEVHRCSVAWWAAAEEASELWPLWGPFLWSYVVARRGLALEGAARLVLANPPLRDSSLPGCPPQAKTRSHGGGSDTSGDTSGETTTSSCGDDSGGGVGDEGHRWLIHIDPDEALCFGGLGDDSAREHDRSGAGAGAECDFDATDRCGNGASEETGGGAVASSGHAGAAPTREAAGAREAAAAAAAEAAAGSAVRFFASLPLDLDEAVFGNLEACPEADPLPGEEAACKEATSEEATSGGVRGDEQSSATATSGGAFGGGGGGSCDWFEAVTLFKASPGCGGAVPFVAYANGKAAVRLADGVVPNGSVPENMTGKLSYSPPKAPDPQSSQ